MARLPRRPEHHLARRRRTWRASNVELATKPPLVFAGEARRLQEQLGRSPRAARSSSRRATAPSPSTRARPTHPRQAQGHPADGRRAHLRGGRAGHQGRTHRRPVRQAPHRRLRGARRRAPRAPFAATSSTPRSSTPSGATARPRAAARRLPPERRDAQPAARLHDRRLRRACRGCTRGTRSSSPTRSRASATR